jgi:hypothetical protein
MRIATRITAGAPNALVAVFCILAGGSSIVKQTLEQNRLAPHRPIWDALDVLSVVVFYTMNWGVPTLLVVFGAYDLTRVVRKRT